MPILRVTAHGKAAHAGNNHQEGANAIWALALFVDRLADVEGVRFTAMAGGTSRNTVPESAAATFECPASVEASLDLDSSVAGTSLTCEQLAP